MHFSGFLHKASVDFGHIKILDAIFSGQSLLSTTVLNDYVYLKSLFLKI